MSSLTSDSYLLTLSQIGLSFAGFSSLIVFLREEPGSAWRRQDIFGVKLILEHTFAMVLLALLAVLLGSRLSDQTTVWKLSSGALALFLAMNLATQLGRLHQLRGMGEKPQYPKGLLFGLLIPTGVVCAFEVSRVCLPSAFWFEIGLLYLLIQAAIQFWILLCRHLTAK